MSRIGKKPIDIPSGVSVEVSSANKVTVKGPKGTLTQQINNNIAISIVDGKVSFQRPNDEKQNRAMHGLYRALVNNMVEGVTKGFRTQLELVGVGYKAEAQGQVLVLSLGYSHSIHFQLPNEVKVSAETPKGKNPIITLECIDKHLIGHIAAKLRSLRKVEPYNGKGVRFVGEVVRKKAGKSAGK